MSSGITTAGYSEPWLLWTLDRVGELELAERVGVVAHAPAVEVDLDDRLVVVVSGCARDDDADVAVEDVAVVVVAHLHDLVADAQRSLRPA